MKLIEPKVELLSELNISPKSHIARCSRICYGHEDKEPNQEADEKMVDGLIKRGHLSMLRHASVYFYDIEDFPDYLKWRIIHSDYWNNNMKYGYASTNFQEFENFEKLVENEADGDCILAIDKGLFLKECTNNPLLFKLFRLTFCITTQISTSRELNRVSPNSIVERSTRYCSSKDGLEICKPWWYDNDGHGLNQRDYNHYCQFAEEGYNRLLKNGMKPEDVRGILPLDTATKVIYTYSIREWQHILDLRYYGTTGKPHPNAKLIAGKIRDEINNFAKEHNIDYQV